MQVRRGGSEDGSGSDGGGDDDDADDADALMSDERYEVEMQMQLFETVMHSDNGDALYALTTGPGGAASLELSLAEPAQLFDAVRRRRRRPFAPTHPGAGML